MEIFAPISEHSGKLPRGDHAFETLEKGALNALTPAIADEDYGPELPVTCIDYIAQSSLTNSVDATKFTYKRLQGANDFRLVLVLPGNAYDLKCKLWPCSLLDPPGYIAISYAWGDGFDKMEMTLEADDDFTVNASLHDALIAVRALDHTIVVWIDGLSIDQSNEAERATQVQLMDQIYKKAASVVVWLGPETEDSRQAIWLIKELAYGEQASSWTFPTALRSFFERDYWKRLWVVQEVYHARSKWVYCGSSKLTWDICKKASDALWQHENDPSLWTGPSSFPDVERLLELGPDSLLEVLRACRRKLCENPRDKVFGILGILPKDVRGRLHVGYDVSVKFLYLSVAHLIVSSTHRLDVIRESIHFPAQVSSADLPTWCPNWAQVPENSALSSENFSAAGDSMARYEFRDGLRKLDIQALELGVIDKTGVAVGTLCSLQDYLMAFLNWRELLLSSCRITEAEEIDHLSVHDFCKTLSLGQISKEKEQCWTRACYQVFSSLIQERFPRLPLEPNFRKQGDLGVLPRHELRPFIQKHFGDRMVSAISQSHCLC